MAPTDLSTVEPPEACTQWVLTAQPQDAIVDHAIAVNLTWWNDALRARELPGVGRRGQFQLCHRRRR